MAHKTLMQISRDEEASLLTQSRFIDSAAIAAKKEEEYFRQLSLMKNIVDYRSGISGAERKGLQKGRRQGLKQGRQQGQQQGRIETARNALAEGVSIDIVCKITGLPLEEIEALAGKVQ